MIFKLIDWNYLLQLTVFIYVYSQIYDPMYLKIIHLYIQDRPIIE